MQSKDRRTHKRYTSPIVGEQESERAREREKVRKKEGIH